METAVIAIAAVVSVCVTLYLFALSQVSFLKKNWPKYRCHPLYMPMAGMVGQDVAANFTKCTMKGFHDYAGFIMDPIMSQFSTFNSVIGDIGNAMNDMRGMMSDVRGGFMGIIGTVFGKIENLMSQFQHIIIRMRTLMGRVTGIMMSFMYIFYGGMQTGESLVAGPIGKTMSVLCFDENTLIKTNSGSTVYMKDLKLGDMLYQNNSVISVYRIDGKGVQMYLLGKTKVSGGHKVWFNHEYIPVAQHPYAVPTSGSQNLVCIDTDKRMFSIGDHHFLDFTEVDDVFGVSDNTMIALKTVDVPVCEVVLGDILLDNDVVRGLVKHLIDDKVVYNLITEQSLHLPKIEILN
jgi:hypothetical protein